MKLRPEDWIGLVELNEGELLACRSQSVVREPSNSRIYRRDDPSRARMFPPAMVLRTSVVQVPGREATGPDKAGLAKVAGPLTLAVALGCWLSSGLAAAAELRFLEVSKDGARIDVQAEIVIDAPLAHVFDVLTSYEQLPELTSRFVESRYLEPADDGAPRIFTHVRGCVLFFCRSVIRVVRLDMIRDWSIIATAEPDLSQVRFGIERWILRADDNATVVTYSHEMEPDFWGPPPSVRYHAIGRGSAPGSLDSVTTASTRSSLTTSR